MNSVYEKWLYANKKTYLRGSIDDEHPRDVDWEAINEQREAIEETIDILDISLDSLREDSVL